MTYYTPAVGTTISWAPAQAVNQARLTGIPLGLFASGSESRLRTVARSQLDSSLALLSNTRANLSVAQRQTVTIKVNALQAILGGTPQGGINTAQLPQGSLVSQIIAGSGLSLPHPDASNQEIGPNLGGADAVTTASDIQQQAASAAKGTFAVAGVGLAVVALIAFVLIAGGK